jgi:hypothetical protein
MLRYVTSCGLTYSINRVFTHFCMINMTQFIWGLKLEGLKNKISTFNKALWGLMLTVYLVNVGCGPGQHWLCTLSRWTVELVNVDSGPGQRWLWTLMTLYNNGLYSRLMIDNEIKYNKCNDTRYSVKPWPGPKSTLTRSTVNIDIWYDTPSYANNRQMIWHTFQC